LFWSFLSRKWKNLIINKFLKYLTSKYKAYFYVSKEWLIAPPPSTVSLFIYKKNILLYIFSRKNYEAVSGTTKTLYPCSVNFSFSVVKARN